MICKNCGASKTELKNGVVVCSYCGSEIEGAGMKRPVQQRKSNLYDEYFRLYKRLYNERLRIDYIDIKLRCAKRDTIFKKRKRIEVPEFAMILAIFILVIFILSIVVIPA